MRESNEEKNPMKKVLLTAAVAACALVFAGQASAQDMGEPWFEVGVSRASVPDLDTSYNILTGRLGSKFSKHFGSELEFGVGLSEDTVEFSGVEVDTKVDYNFGAFLTGEVAVSKQVTLIGRIGYARTQFNVSAGSYDETAEAKGASAGVGLKVTGKSGKNGLRVDFTRLQDAGDATDFVSATFVRKF